MARAKVNNKKNMKMSMDQKTMKLIAVVVLIIALLFRKSIPKKIRSVLEPLILFLLVLILISLYTTNTVHLICITLIIFIIIMMMRRETMSFENFANESEKDQKQEDDFKKMLQKELEKVQNVAEKKTAETSKTTDSSLKPPDSSGISHLFQGDAGKALDNLDGLLKKMNGGIELKEDDKKETKPMNEDASKYSDDSKPSALKQAQKETYELINTVNALKDTIETLSPVLQEGKKLMGMFESLKI